MEFVGISACTSVTRDLPMSVICDVTYSKVHYNILGREGDVGVTRGCTPSFEL